VGDWTRFDRMTLPKPQVPQAGYSFPIVKICLVPGSGHQKAASRHHKGAVEFDGARGRWAHDCNILECWDELGVCASHPVQETGRRESKSLKFFQGHLLEGELGDEVLKAMATV
jgi:hypothetical protein